MSDPNDYELKPPASAPPPSRMIHPPAPAPAPATAPAPAPVPQAQNNPDTTSMEIEDIRHNKGMAMLAYIGILVLVPLVFGQHSKFVRHHTNQGLILFILEVVAWVGCKILMLLGYPIVHLHAVVYLTSFLGGLIWLGFALISLIGLLHVIGGSFGELPAIGAYEIIHVQGSED